MAAKKKPKASDRRSSTNGKKPRAKKTAVPAPFEPGDSTFVLGNFDQAARAIATSIDLDRRVSLGAKLQAMRKKFQALPESKVTRDRCERYVQEIQKILAELTRA